MKIRKADDDYYGAIFGLSYSFKGIDVGRLQEKFYNFSYDGRDIYYNMQLFKFALSLGKFTNLKVAILAFPCYYFNYDQSQSYAQYESAQIYSVWELDDWHNYKKTKINLDKVENYITNYRMFGKKISEYFHGSYHKKHYITYKGNMNLAKSYTVDRRLPTVTENISIFSEFIKLLNERGIRIIFAVTPILLTALNEESLHKVKLQVDDVSHLVKEIADSAGVAVEFQDFSNQFADRTDLFRDLDHLNANGAVVFGNLLDSLLFGKKICWNEKTNMGYCFC